MEFVTGFMLTAILFLALFFLVVYGVISFIINQITKPLRPILSQLKDSFKQIMEK